MMRITIDHATTTDGLTVHHHADGLTVEDIIGGGHWHPGPKAQERLDECRSESELEAIAKALALYHPEFGEWCD